MSEQFFRPARLDIRAMVTTGLFIALGIYMAGFSEGPIWIRSLLGVVLLGITVVFAVRGYAIEADAVVVKHYLWQRRFPLADLEAATLDPGALVGSIRTFGIGGVFGYIGRFRNRQLGSYLAYVTDGTHAVVMKFPKKTLVISPDDHVGFLEKLLATGRIA